MGKVYHIGHGNLNDEASWSVPHHEDKVVEYILPESNNRELTREEALFENEKLYSDDPIDIRSLPRGMAWEAPDVLDEAYADGRVARHAINRLRELSKDRKQPFFMAVGFIRPHLPFSVPKKYWDMYDRDKLPMPVYEKDPDGAPKFAVKIGGEINAFKPIPEDDKGLFDEELKRNLIHGYYASISYMDKQLGRVIDELKRLNLDKNTIIVLWGDHGWHLGDHGIWTKHTNYEQATRIPLLIKAPGITTAGSVSNQTVETVDIYPTLTDLAGLAKPSGPQPIDGISLKQVLKDPSLKNKDHIYHAYPREGNMGEAIRTERYRMVKWTNMKDKSKVVYELYDYETDPNETVNIAKQNPAIIKKLLKILNSYPTAKGL
jgi:iduronate 2-sulfatase